MADFENGNSDNNENKKKNNNPNIDEDEETEEYKDKKREPFLNEQRGAFDSHTFDGINSRKDVFERTAVFHVNRTEE